MFGPARSASKDSTPSTATSPRRSLRMQKISSLFSKLNLFRRRRPINPNTDAQSILSNDSDFNSMDTLDDELEYYRFRENEEPRRLSSIVKEAMAAALAEQLAAERRIEAEMAKYETMKLRGRFREML